MKFVKCFDSFGNEYSLSKYCVNNEYYRLDITEITDTIEDAEDEIDLEEKLIYLDFENAVWKIDRVNKDYNYVRFVDINTGMNFPKHYMICAYD